MSTFRLPRLPQGVAIVDPKTGIPTDKFRRWWQAFASDIEIEVGALAAAQLAQAAAVTATAAAATAQTAATTASTAAATAQTSANGANSVASLTNSGVTPNPLTATDAGASATITIAGHTRVYGSGTSVAVTGGSLTGRAYSTLYYVYYDQVSRLGGAVTYASTTSVTTAAQTGDRHLVGKITTPAAAAPATTGNEVQVPGLGNIP